jgi:hypothetical protein
MLTGPAIAEMKIAWQQQSARFPTLSAGVETWRVAAARIKSGVEMLRVCTLDAYHAVRPRRPRQIDLSVTAIKTQLS